MNRSLLTWNLNFNLNPLLGKVFSKIDFCDDDEKVSAPIDIHQGSPKQKVEP